MTDGFYYWTYRSHPHSNEDFLYDGILPYVPDSHVAHSMSKDIIGEIDDPAVKHDLGVHLITPINKLIREEYGVDEIQEVKFNDIDRQNLIDTVRGEITDEDILEVGDRQEKMEKHQMGDDVEGVVEFNRD